LGGLVARTGDLFKCSPAAPQTDWAAREREFDVLPLTCEGTGLPSAFEGSPSMSKIDLLQGTLDLLILRVLARGEDARLGHCRSTGPAFPEHPPLDEGSVYPSLCRMEGQGLDHGGVGAVEQQPQGEVLFSDKTGRKRLEVEQQNWGQLSAIIAEVMQKA
jgi:PadR family transcriptional regulator, regulatory protein PadR